MKSENVEVLVHWEWSYTHGIKELGDEKGLCPLGGFL